ncbi:uncharacterized protein LOC143631368 [Bidens hawaiensis]|uniref:uncharacterized protein LOC143631368 n=1 Tax=Bidens hawaiensis TaxID=980011 RepID=UPI00404AF272
MASPAPAKSQPLHNFSLPHLQWRSHRTGRNKLAGDTKGKRTNNNNKICIRIRKHDVSHVTEESQQNRQNGVVQLIEEEDTSPKIWKLRPRRPLISHKQSNPLTLPENRYYYYYHECNNNNNINNNNKGVLEGKAKNNENSIQMALRKKHNNKLSISLSKDEIEEDMFALTGAKPARRPKKRPRSVQKQLDTLFPGLWLGSINADTYKVSEGRSKI